MFPKAFQTSVYTEQATICPSDIPLLPAVSSHWQSPVMPSFDSRLFVEQFGVIFLPRLRYPQKRKQIQEVLVEQPVAKRCRKAEAEFPKSNNAVGTSRRKRKGKQQVTDSEESEPEVEQPAAKRRRKAEPPEHKFFCPVPGCSAGFTAKQRVGSHIKARHHGIRDFFCGAPGCPYISSNDHDVTRHILTCKYV
ncbi:hypothetical protein BYT27DRAFT_6371159 [Phlegmacium glaucopus]|nr:hypothetical protein BYT27DRAFT_6371159 [Phlegmacium glaucopus]